MFVVVVNYQGEMVGKIRMTVTLVQFAAQGDYNPTTSKDLDSVNKSEEKLSINHKNPVLQYDYSEIPLLRPPKIKTSYLLKSLICKVQVILFFIFYTQWTSDERPPLGLSKSGL